MVNTKQYREYGEKHREMHKEVKNIRTKFIERLEWEMIERKK